MSESFVRLSESFVRSFRRALLVHPKFLFERFPFSNHDPRESKMSFKKSLSQVAEVCQARLTALSSIDAALDPSTYSGQALRHAQGRPGQRPDACQEYQAAAQYAHVGGRDGQIRQGQRNEHEKAGGTRLREIKRSPRKKAAAS